MSDFNHTAIRVARKPYRCDLCDSSIDRHQPYEDSSGRYDGDFYHCRRHRMCVELTRLWLKESDQEWCDQPIFSELLDDLVDRIGRQNLLAWLEVQAFANGIHGFEVRRAESMINNINLRVPFLLEAMHCPVCNAAVSLDPSWRWNGTVWQHAHNEVQAGHFDAVPNDSGEDHV